MNLLLIEPADLVAPGRARIAGRRLAHLRQVLRAKPGDGLRVGLVDGALGCGRVLALGADAAELAVVFDRAAPPPLPVVLVLALPRPKSLRRILQTTAAMGVKTLFLINSFRVEKSFWQSPLLTPAALREQLLLGLEQGGDTRLPRVVLRDRFRPFVEDELPAIVGDDLAVVAHPRAAAAAPAAWDSPLTLAIGPEGGFIDYEIAALVAAGFAPVSLGPRILRVDTALAVLLGRCHG